MKLLKSKTFIFVALILLIGGGYLVYKKRNAVEPQFVAVKRMDIVEDVSITGTVKSKEAVSLGFETSGKIGQIFVKVGDKVNAGSPLVFLQNNDLRADISQAEANLKSAQAVLGALVRGSRPEQIELEKTKIKNAKQALKDAETSLGAQLISVFTAVNDAVENRTDQFFTNPRSTTPTINFSVADSALKNKIEDGRYRLEKIFPIWRDNLNLLQAGSIDLETMIAYSTANLLEVGTFLDNVSRAVNTLTTAYNYSQTTIDGWKADVATARTNINSALSGSATYAEGWRSAKSAVALEEEQLNILLAGSDPFDVKSQEAKVMASEASLEKLNVSFNKTELLASTVGVVTMIDAKVGESVTAGVPVVKIIGEGDYEVEANVPETDIGRVHLLSPVTITFDAYPGEKFFGIVSQVDPAETIIDGVVSYKIKIAFDKPDTRIKSGLTTNLEIQSNKKIGVLSLPQTTVTETDTGATVKKKTGTSVADVPVKIGARDRDGNVEITSGLAEGDQIQIVGLK